MRLLLVLTIVFSLAQIASAERWRGLIASVAALESAKKSVVVPISVSSPISILVSEKQEYKAPIPDSISGYKKVCKDGSCRLVPIPSAEVVIGTKKVMSSSTVKKKPFRKWRFRLFRRNCSNCR